MSITHGQCEEKACENLQSAICLHCNHRLCTAHVIAHGTALLEETNELGEKINELIKHLDVSLDQIHLTRNKSMNAVAIWRQKQIDKIEDEYTEKVKEIELKQDSLVELKNKLLQRLTKDAREPLKHMQTQKSANSQIIQAIHQTIDDINQESIQLQWQPIESFDQSSLFDIKNTVINTPQLHNQYQNKNHLPKNYVQQHPPINSFANYQPNLSYIGNCPPLMHIVPSRNTFTNIPYSLMNSSGFSPMITPQFVFNQMDASFRPYWLQSTVTSTTPAYRLLSPSTISTTSQIDINRLPTNSCEKLRNFFMNVSGSNDQLLDNFIINNLNRAIHVNNMMLLILSFLEAWHSKNFPSIFNDRVLSYHIFTIQKYINGRDHELTAIAAILVFINSCNDNENRSSRMMTILLQHFFDHKCITKATILDWYENGASYGYKNFQNAKLWAKPFIDQLNIIIQSEHE